MKKKIGIYLLISIGIALIIHLVNYIALGFDQAFLWQWKSMFINYCYAAIIGGANVACFYFLNLKGSWEKHPKQMIFLGVVGSVVVSTLSFFIARLVHVVGIENNTFQEFLAAEHLGNYFFRC